MRGCAVPKPESTADRLRARIQQWLDAHTFHHSAFQDIRQLVALKERQGLSISLCIPTLNEEKTIGKEIVMFKSDLMTRAPLLDEIAVIDSGSTDRTLEVASAFGADVYLSSDILPEEGSKRGKGENLWKAIYQLKGDIIVYVDADIKNVHPRFVYGLVGPLLVNPGVGYVKAFYDRPLAGAGALRPTGGGRVTEILVRPLFSLFFPELTALVQPLSGEYAVRRSVLERLPFPIGYGVETSHLIDAFRMWGLDVFAQTDLDQRIHRNQPIQDLGRMAFGILQAFLLRTEKLGIVEDLPDLHPILRQFQTQDNRYRQSEHEIREEERPPMIENPQYRHKFGRES